MSNSPYGTRPAPLDVAAITSWNAGIARARADYEAHPFADGRITSRGTTWSAATYASRAAKQKAYRDRKKASK